MNSKHTMTLSEFHLIILLPILGAIMVENGGSIYAQGVATSPAATETEHSHQPDTSIRLYTNEEAEIFRVKLDLLKYPTTIQTACDALGIDLKRLTGSEGLMKSVISGRSGQQWVQLSENYWISFHFQLYGQRPGGEVALLDKPEYDKVSIYTHIDLREVHKKEDKLQVSVHDDTLFVDAESPSGVGGARLALTSGNWPKKVVVRLRYAPAKPFTRIEGPGATLEEKNQKDEYLEVRYSPTQDNYEADLPPTERIILYLHWVDGHRN